MSISIDIMRFFIYLVGAILIVSGDPLRLTEAKSWPEPYLGRQPRKEPVNEHPIIGVVAQEMNEITRDEVGMTAHSYIAASYVKFIEGGGARVVPIWINKPKKYYEKIMKRINGVLFPGGGVDFYSTHGYGQVGRYVYEIAKEMNDNGEYFPLWGTCLGFELLAYLSNNNTDAVVSCSGQSLALNLNFTYDFKKSRLFAAAPQDVIDILSMEKVTPNFHHYCLTQENLMKFGLDQEWTVISLNKDRDGIEFISSFEHKHYPYYGVQFHPEKNIYEWPQSSAISHTANAIKASQYFAQFFVDEARKSLNQFKTTSEASRYLIYNWPPYFTGRNLTASFEQSYVFEDASGDGHLEKLD